MDFHHLNGGGGKKFNLKMFKCHNHLKVLEKKTHTHTVDNFIKWFHSPLHTTNKKGEKEEKTTSEALPWLDGWIDCCYHARKFQHPLTTCIKEEWESTLAGKEDK